LYLIFNPSVNAQTEPTRMAFMADVHLLDVYGTLDDSGYKGVETEHGKHALVRTMSAQTRSTRLFNENYFAFLSALDLVVDRGIRWVILPGDFSDDGQPLNLRGLQGILEYYTREHGLSFLAITGNHDPSRPYGKEGGKRDFLGADGRAQPIMSAEGIYQADPEWEHPTLISADLAEGGYAEILSILGAHGFMPQNEYYYWSHPFTDYTVDNYSPELARSSAGIEHRIYRTEGSAHGVPDLSYLVEPVEGVWVLALDANVYLPLADGSGYQGSGVGYSRILKHKPYLLPWVQTVASEARARNKLLIAFSHYPLLEFNDGASEEIRSLLGPGAMQSHRIPEIEVAEAFADAGIRIHVGGHMHLNDTGLYQRPNRFLVNIQCPSLAGYPPAFKVLTLHSKNVVDVETVVLDSVPGFDSFFPLYRQEYEHLSVKGAPMLWDRGILESENYYEYTLGHMKNLLKLRFLPGEWPSDIRDELEAANGRQLLALTLASRRLTREAFREGLKGNTDIRVWKQALRRASRRIKASGYPVAAFENWHGHDWILAFYLLRYADELAIQDIDPEWLDQFRWVANSFRAIKDPDWRMPYVFLSRMYLKQFEGAPAGNFRIDLESGSIRTLPPTTIQH